MKNSSKEKAEQLKYIFCNKCQCETEHICKGEQFRDFENVVENQLVFVEREGSRFWICLGCKKGTLEEYYIFDVTSRDYLEEDTWDIQYYPERNRLHIKSKEFIQLPGKLLNIYKETLRAYNNNLSILCAIGIRSLLEGICADKNIDGKDLQEKINGMIKILPKNIVMNLHSIRFIGNSAAHELSAPRIEELKIAIEICEDLLNFIYELDYKARELYTSQELRDKNTKN